MGIDQMGVDKMGVDEMEVDEMEVDEMGIDEMGTYQIAIRGLTSHPCWISTIQLIVEVFAVVSTKKLTFHNNHELNGRNPKV